MPSCAKSEVRCPWLARPGSADPGQSGPLTEVDLPGRRSDWHGSFVESPGGVSPPGAPRTVREPLDSYGSRCSAVSMTERQWAVLAGLLGPRRRRTAQFNER